MSKEIQSFIDLYTGICHKKKLIPIEPVINHLDSTNLDTLNLKGNQEDLRFSRINDASIDALSFSLTTFNFLRVMDLRYNEIGDMGASALSNYLMADNLLEVLILKSNNIGAIGCTSICEALQHNQRINQLDISENSINDEGGLAIAKMLQINTVLLNISVSGCKLNADSLIAIMNSIKEANIVQQLDISNNTIISGRLSNSLLHDVLTHLSIMIRDCSSIRILDTSKMYINDEAIMNLIAPALRVNSTIEDLNLSCNRIGRNGGAALCNSLHGNLELRVLKLSCCTLQDEGAFAVAKLILENASLKEIYLDYNKVTNEGLLSIGKSVSKTFSLKYVALWGNLWGPESSKIFNQLQGGHRLGRDGADVCFREVEGILQVARVEKK